MDTKAVETRLELSQANDDAAEALQGEDLVFTEEENRKLVKKLDWILMPMLCLAAGVTGVDKITLGSAATLTLLTDLKLHGHQYSWTVSSYFFGLLIGAYPINFLLQRYHTGRVAGAACAIWGLVMLGTAGVNNFEGMFALRFLLGLFEGAVPAGCTMVTGRFYTQSESPWRFALWGMGTSLFPVPFLLLFFGLGQVPDHPLQPWRWLFIVMGIISVITGLLIYVIVPDKPSTCWWLSARQRAVAVERIAQTQAGIKNSTFKWNQAREAVTDVKTWCLAFMLGFQQSGAVISTNFSGLLLKRFGFKGFIAILLSIPNWAMGAIALLTIGSLTTFVPRFRRVKTLFLAFNATLVVISGVMLFTFQGVSKRDEAIGIAFVALQGVNNASYSLMLTLIGQNAAGTTKKQVTWVITYSFYCISNICIPQSFLAEQAPKYTSGLISVASCQAGLVVLSLVFYVYCTRENNRREKWQSEQPPESEEVEAVIMAGLADETDRKNLRFRYWP